MFKLITEIFKREDLLQQAYKTTIEMLKFDQQMFEASYQSLIHNLCEVSVEKLDVYATDRKINEYQREVRRKVVAHLATSSSRDIVFGLILVSIIIDVERIGDYTKNIQDLACNHPHPIDYHHYNDEIKNIETNVATRFKKLIYAFEHSDDDIARELMVGHKKINETCDRILLELLKDNINWIHSNEAVAIALYVRYLKRISAHMTNVASSIVNSFENIGFKGY